MSLFWQFRSGLYNVRADGSLVAIYLLIQGHRSFGFDYFSIAKDTATYEFSCVFGYYTVVEHNVRIHAIPDTTTPVGIIVGSSLFRVGN
jgi:hypothetical protein